MSFALTDSSPAPRYHALDSLRAAMMLLGVVFHSSLSYTALPLDGIWPFKDSHTNFGFDLLAFFLHSFRMPVFFVLAGFFGALLFQRRSAREFILNRRQRIALPLVVGLIVLLPIMALVSLFVNPAVIADKEFFRPSLLHLWFLYHLLIFYAILFFFAWSRRRFKSNRLLARCRQRIQAIFRRALLSPLRAIFFALPTMAVLLCTEKGVLETSASLLPPLPLLAAHGMFFFFGWLLYRHRDLLSHLARRAWLPVFAAVLCFPLYMAALFRLGTSTLRAEGIIQPSYLAVVVSSSVMVWLLIFGLIGLSLRYLDRPLSGVRYLSDASYWIYLVHLPFTVLLPGLLASLSLPAFVKFFAVLSATLFVTIFTYHFGVRSTIIGRFLNGKTYPVTAPRFAFLRLAGSETN